MEHLIFSLIKDDLIHTRLLYGLTELGFDTTDYYLNLDETVFTLAGFTSEQVTEELREWYFRHMEKARFLTVPPRANVELEKMAVMIYAELLLKLE